MVSRFSSPLGDGLVPYVFEDTDTLFRVFVPAWGWVGSQFSGHSITLNVRSFRPRLGMGWFEDGLMFSEVQQLFSSPLGDGLVLTNNGYINRNIIFSSPSGDGLVPEAPADDDAAEIIFVPEWGWVGS